MVAKVQSMVAAAVLLAVVLLAGVESRHSRAASPPQQRELIGLSVPSQVATIAPEQSGQIVAAGQSASSAWENCQQVVIVAVCAEMLGLMQWMLECDERQDTSFSPPWCCILIFGLLQYPPLFVHFEWIHG